MPKTNQPWTIVLDCVCGNQLVVMAEVMNPDVAIVCDAPDCEGEGDYIMRWVIAWKNTLLPPKNVKRFKPVRCCATCEYLEYDNDETQFCVRPDADSMDLIFERFDAMSYWTVCDRWKGK